LFVDKDGTQLAYCTQLRQMLDYMLNSL